MIHMQPEILEFLKAERVGVLTVLINDNQPHGATVHFACNCDPENSVFYFQTFKDSVKAQAFIHGNKCKSSFVIGTDEQEMQTMQLDGVVELLDHHDTQECVKHYFRKFPEKIERAKDQRAVYFIFKPTWWRYSHFKRQGGKLIVASDNSSHTTRSYLGEKA
jgi:hypothetical protein